MRAKDYRKAIPVGVKLHSCLLLLGFSEEEISGGLIEYDHCPALALRSIDPQTGQMVPHPNDPRYIEPRRKVDHAVKTRGSGATTAGSDVGSAAKLKRIEKDPAGGEAFRAKLLATKITLTGCTTPEQASAFSRWEQRSRQKQKIKTRKQPWLTRPFPKRIS